MTTVEYIGQELALTRGLILPLLEDMRDAPLQMPTAHGGNPPLWVLAHLAYAEANLIEHVIRGRDNPLLEWKSRFGPGCQPSERLEDYPVWQEAWDRWDAVREGTLAFVHAISDADLATPTMNGVSGREAMFGTTGNCLRTISLHTMMHYGQVADARRMAGRPPLNG